MDNTLMAPPPPPDDAEVPDTATLALVLGHQPGSATAHLLAACEAGGHSVIEALRGPFPDVVTAWEAWRKHAAPHLWQVPTAAQVRAALARRTPVRAAS